MGPQSSDGELRDAMARTMSGFADVVAGIEQPQWDLPTPCTDWTVFDVVDHVVAGERFTVGVLGGASLDDAVAAQVGLDRSDPDVAAQVRDAAADALASFGGSLDRIIEHRVGAITARRMLGFRIIDQLGHTWDVAEATGQPVALDPVALQIGVAIALSERPTLERSPNFATEPDDVDDDVVDDPLSTLLHTIGRTPRSS